MKDLKKRFEPTTEEIKKVEEVKETIPEKIRGTCSYCSKPVYENDKYSKQVGQYYHRNCWKEVYRQGWQG